MMQQNFYSVITGSGRYIATEVIKNELFTKNSFYNAAGEKIEKPTTEIVEKLRQITEIEERRYVSDNLVTSDIGYLAALDAINTSGVDAETFDYIIVAHNFGDVLHDNVRSDMVPTIAARVKNKLGIKNPNTVAYDLPFGCPGWLQAMIQADYYIKSGDAKRILVIGAETLSRISDPHDIDSMIYSDGAGAVILEAKESTEKVGILAHKTRSDTFEHAHLLRMRPSYKKDFKDNTLFMKMDGRKLYEYAISTVPQAIQLCIEKAGLDIKDIKKILIHQANAKLDDAILCRLYKLYNITEIPEGIMPMTISKLGNNSVATLPILYDYIMKGIMPGQSLNSGDAVVFASVGAGMNINAVVYRVPA